MHATPHFRHDIQKETLEVTKNGRLILQVDRLNATYVGLETSSGFVTEGAITRGSEETPSGVPFAEGRTEVMARLRRIGAKEDQITEHLKWLDGFDAK